MLQRALTPSRPGGTAGSFNIETGDPPAGWGVRRTISNKEFRTAEVFEKSKTMFFTSIFCGSLFCGSAVYILKDLIADDLMQSDDRRDLILRFQCSGFSAFSFTP
jgi:hypothetical protein